MGEIARWPRWAEGAQRCECRGARQDRRGPRLAQPALAADPASRSKTSVCLSVAGADEGFIKKFAGLLEAEGAAYDIAGYRDAPPGLRIWCGATVDTADIEALGPWLDWAYASLDA